MRQIAIQPAHCFVRRKLEIASSGEPWAVLKAVSAYASDEASYVNDQAIAVDGGLSASVPYAGRIRK